MNRRMTIYFLLPILFAAFLIFPHRSSAADAVRKIGYANLQKALNECEAGKKAKEDIKAEAKKQEKELNKRQEELKKLKKEIDEKGSLWNKDVSQQKEKEFQAKIEDFRKFVSQSSQALQKKKQEREAQIIKEMIELLKEIGKSKGYTYIFERSAGALLVAPKKDDLTDEVIKKYNKKFKSENKEG